MFEEELVTMDICDSVGGDDEHEDDLSVDITAKQAAENYQRAGSRVDNDESIVTWAKYGHLYNPELKAIVEDVLCEAQFSGKLSEFQEIFLHTIGSKKDLFAVVNTGAGKTEATGLSSLLLRKIFKEPNGLIIVFVPLTGIMEELVNNEKISTAAVSMSGQMFGKMGEGRVSVTEADILAGKFIRLVMHPEALKNSSVEKIMLRLKQEQKVLGVFVDEFHVIQPTHWASFRPVMEEQTARLRVFLRKRAPTGALSATATQADVDRAVQTLGLRGNPVVVAESPLQSHYKFVVLKRPSDNYGFEGYLDQKDKFHPGLLDQLRVIYIDEYVRCILTNEEPKHAIIFFRTENQLIFLLNYLSQTLGISNARSAPFVSLVASTPPVTEMVINKRKGSISLYLTTQKMLLGVNVPGLEICIFVKPMNMLHALIQGAGRTGRPLFGEPGVRARSLVYILGNGGDVGSQVKGMSEEVRDLIKYKSGCLSSFMSSFFLGNNAATPRKSDWCCSFCSS